MKMDENWDQFEPFKILEKYDFSFSPSLFEVWVNGSKNLEGTVSSELKGTVVKKDGTEKMLVTFKEKNLENEIFGEIYFDEFVTSLDRLKLLAIPSETYTENIGLLTLRIIYGSTRGNYDFKPKEPYCCNLFFQSGVLMKVTFLFSYPVKLIELLR